MRTISITLTEQDWKMLSKELESSGNVTDEFAALKTQIVGQGNYQLGIQQTHSAGGASRR